MFISLKLIMYTQWLSLSVLIMEITLILIDRILVFII